MDDLEEFSVQLVRLNGAMKELFDKGDIKLFTEMNAAIKELHAIEKRTDSKAVKGCSKNLGIIYENFDMIIKVLRTTEDGEIDPAAQGAINHFLHNIDTAVLGIATFLQLI